MTLADIFNSPSTVPFEGVDYKLRQPTLIEQGLYQRWLEQRAYDAIERRTYQDRGQQEVDRNNLNRDVAAGVYEWGGEVCCNALRTPNGLAKLVGIVCQDQGLSDAAARRLVDLKLKEIAAALMSKATADPNSLRATLASLGLPEDFLSSNSPTPPSSTNSATSEASTGTRSPSSS